MIRKFQTISKWNLTNKFVLGLAGATAAAVIGSAGVAAAYPNANMDNGGNGYGGGYGGSNTTTNINLNVTGDNNFISIVIHITHYIFG
jgi:hypothetical protein